MNNPHDTRRLASALVADAIAAPPERILTDAMYRAVDDLEGQGERSERIARQLLEALLKHERATLTMTVHPDVDEDDTRECLWHEPDPEHVQGYPRTVYCDGSCSAARSRAQLTDPPCIVRGTE